MKCGFLPVVPGQAFINLVLKLNVGLFRRSGLPPNSPCQHHHLIQPKVLPYSTELIRRNDELSSASIRLVPSPQDYRDYKITRVKPVKRSFPAEYTYPYLILTRTIRGHQCLCCLCPESHKRMQEYKSARNSPSFPPLIFMVAREPMISRARA